MFSCQSCLFGGFLVHRPRGRIQVLPAHLALSRHGFLCLLTHQLYSYCLQGRLSPSCLLHQTKHFQMNRLFLQYVLQKKIQNDFFY